MEVFYGDLDYVCGVVGDKRERIRKSKWTAHQNIGQWFPYKSNNWNFPSKLNSTTQNLIGNLFQLIITKPLNENNKRFTLIQPTSR